MRPVPEDLRLLLAEARRHGVPFDDAWQAACADAITSARGVERSHWLVALSSTREAWRAAYEGQPATRNVAAVALIAV